MGEVTATTAEWVFRAIMMLIVAVVIGFILRPLRIPLGLCRSTRRFPLNYATVPLIACLLLLCCTALSFTDVWLGIRGHPDSIQPWSIILLLYSLAYGCLSLTQTGFLRYISLKLMPFATSRTRLLCIVFFMSATFTLITSNDVVILALTPIICQLCSPEALDISPWPYLYAQYFAANIISVVLVIGNPTNVIVAQANNLEFAHYSKWMALPGVFASLVALFVLLFYFRADLRQPIAARPTVPMYTIQSPLSATFGVGLLLLALALMFGLSFLKVQVYIIATAFGVSVLIKDILFDLFDGRCRLPRVSLEPEAQQATTYQPFEELEVELSPETVSELQIADIHQDDDHQDTGNVLAEVTTGIDQEEQIEEQEIYYDAPQEVANVYGETIAAAAEIAAAEDEAEEQQLQTQLEAEFGADSVEVHSIPAAITPWMWLNNRFPGTLSVLRSLPPTLLPFMLGMFILVQGLISRGVVDLLASGLVRGVLGATGYNLVAVVYIFGVFATLSCSVLNNQPMTILFSAILNSSQSAELVGSSRLGAMFALILASNLGANFTLLAALAGIMWRQTLIPFNLEVHPSDFAKKRVLDDAPYIDCGVVDGCLGIAHFSLTVWFDPAYAAFNDSR